MVNGTNQNDNIFWRTNKCVVRVCVFWNCIEFVRFGESYVLASHVENNVITRSRMQLRAIFNVFADTELAEKVEADFKSETALFFYLREKRLEIVQNGYNCTKINHMRIVNKTFNKYRSKSQQIGEMPKNFEHQKLANGKWFELKYVHESGLLSKTFHRNCIERKMPRKNSAVDLN